MSTQPEPPTGVVVTLRDGTNVPAELAYRGLVFDGEHLTHRWVITARVRVADLADVTVETMPPRTSLVLEVAQ